MATLGELKTKVSDRLLDPNGTSVSTSNVASAINDAVAYWKFRRFWFNTANDESTLTAQSPIIPLPSDFLVELPMNDGFVIAYSDMRYPLIKKNPRDFDDAYLGNGFGLPEIYTIKSGVYYCYFIPDQNYTIRRYWLKEYDVLSDDGDSNDFTTYAPRLIALWALANLMGEFRQDADQEGYYRAAAADEYKNLGVMNAKANSPGHVTIHSCL